MQVDNLIIGQGICGTFLSWCLEKAGMSYLVIDDAKPHSASRSAAGLINPVTGRRIVTTWMIEELMPFAEDAYRSIGAGLGAEFMEKTSLIDFFPSAQMRLAFLDRYQQDPTYLRLPANEQDMNGLFHYELGYGLIDPCYLIDLPGLTAAARSRLRDKGLLREEPFEVGDVQIDPSSTNIRYHDITAGRIIFCDGVASAGSRWFSRLPFAPNKGEALILEIPDMPQSIYKKGVTLAPWSAGKNQFWVGSSYEWSFSDDQPTAAFRERTEASLKEWLKLPFRVLDHIAAVRPATLERRPFVGFHPLYPSVGILNGMGTKGCSLAPYFAHQLTQHILTGTAIRPDADVKRFSKILSR